MGRHEAGNVTVELVGLDELLERAAAAAPAVAAECLTEEAHRVVDGAVDRWPVGDHRGRRHSRDLFHVETSVADDDVDVRVTNDAPYVGEIKGDPLGALVRGPLAEMDTDEIVRRVGALVEG